MSDWQELAEAIDKAFQAVKAIVLDVIDWIRELGDSIALWHAWDYTITRLGITEADIRTVERGPLGTLIVSLWNRRKIPVQSGDVLNWAAA